MRSRLAVDGEDARTLLEVCRGMPSLWRFCGPRRGWTERRCVSLNQMGPLTKRGCNQVSLSTGSSRVDPGLISELAVIVGGKLNHISAEGSTFVIVLQIIK